MRKDLSRRERNRRRAAANGAPIGVSPSATMLKLYRQYQEACEAAEQDALTDLHIAAGQPDFEPAFASIAVEASPKGQTSFRCTPMYMGEAVGPTREVRID